MIEKNIYANLECDKCKEKIFNGKTPKNDRTRELLKIKSKCFQCPKCNKKFCKTCFNSQFLCPECIDEIPTSINLKISNWADKSSENIRFFKGIYGILFLLSFSLAVIIPINLTERITEFFGNRSLWVIVYIILGAPGFFLAIFYLRKSLLEFESVEDYIIWYFAKLIVSKALNKREIDQILFQLEFKWKNWRVLREINLKYLIDSEDPIEYYLSKIDASKK